MRLFKFQAVTLYSIDALKQRKWWFSSPSNFNDPFEFKLIVPDATKLHKVKFLERVKEDFANDLAIEQIGNNPAISDDEKQSIVNNIIESFPPDLELVPLLVDRYQPELEKVGVVSLTENNDNILMWSHYANFHRGVCFEYEIPVDEPSKRFVHKVIYSDDYPDINLEHFPNIERMFNYQFFTKSKDWCYEREWRCIMRPSNSLTSFTDFAELKSVIFGARTSEDDKSLIRSILQGDDIAFYQASLHPFEYKLNITPV